MGFIHYSTPDADCVSTDYTLYEKYIQNKYRNFSPFFISDWNSSALADSPKGIISEAMNQAILDADTYYQCNNNSCQDRIAKILDKKYGIYLSPSQIIIGNNATSLICFSIQALLAMGKKNYLAIAPVYFSAVDAITLGKGNLFIYQPCYPNLDIMGDEIEKIVNRENTEVLIITDPYFGFGKRLDQDQFLNLINCCRKHGLILLCDFARYGIDWYTDEEDILFCNKIKYFSKYDSFFAIFSPCKKLFANGIKAAVLLTSKNLSQYSDYADSFLGSISSPQFRFLDALLCIDNSLVLQNTIQKNRQRIKNNYELISSLCLGSTLELSNPDIGNYMVIGAKSSKNSYEMFKNVLDNCNLLTLPLELYHFFVRNRFLFRVNLLLSTAELLNSIEVFQKFIERNL